MLEIFPDKHHPQIVQNGGRIIFLRSDAEISDPNEEDSRIDQQTKSSRQIAFTGYNTNTGYYNAYFPGLGSSQFLFGGPTSFREPSLSSLVDDIDDEVLEPELFQEEVIPSPDYVVIPTGSEEYEFA
ncbi:unnamed protein product [Allacma fusca]|uniref:Uncharacterized protein n=1 Tax=Allacma fusca TaxID=39272 RepID=A0A8J2PDQ3_9HEXA|nr:unnamed protein product [Allacma fusca]